MTNGSVPQRHEPRAPTSGARRPAMRLRHVAGALAHLAAIGLVGPIVFTGLLAVAGLGLGLLPVIGLGLVFWATLPYLLFAIAWIESARVDGLYGFGLRPLRLRRSGRPGFAGFLRTLWQQLIDPTMWRGVADAVIATLLGLLVLSLLTVFASAVTLAFAPLFATAGSLPLARTGIEIPGAWASIVGVLTAVLTFAAIVGMAVLHGVIARAIMVPSRESELAQEARASQAQRVGAVRAAEVERARIERDLHDGVQPRLVSIGMSLGLAQQKIDDDPEAAKGLIAEAHASTKSAVTELRQLARGIHTSVLDDRGLDAALSALAGRSHIPVVLDVRITERCSSTAEAAVYFVIAESLTNAAKHSRAAECRVLVRERDGGMLWARVEDNGAGGAQVVPGGGLDGIANRVLGAGGAFRLDSPIAGPTTVEVSIPCAS